MDVQPDVERQDIVDGRAAPTLISDWPMTVHAFDACCAGGRRTEAARVYEEGICGRL